MWLLIQKKILMFLAKIFLKIKLKRSADKQQNLDKEKKNTAVIENINIVKQTHTRHCCYFCRRG